MGSSFRETSLLAGLLVRAPALRPPGLLETVRAIAPQSLWAAEELIVPGGAALRPAVLDAVRSAGAVVRGLTAEEGRLETLYGELVGDPRP